MTVRFHTPDAWERSRLLESSPYLRWKKQEKLSGTIRQSTNQSINQSINRTNKQSIDQSKNQSTTVLPVPRAQIIFSRRARSTISSLKRQRSIHFLNNNQLIHTRRRLLNCARLNSEKPATANTIKSINQAIERTNNTAALMEQIFFRLLFVRLQNTHCQALPNLRNIHWTDISNGTW